MNRRDFILASLLGALVPRALKAAEPEYFPQVQRRQP